MQSIKKHPGHLYCFDKHYANIYIVIFYDVKGTAKDNIAYLLNVDYESKTIKIL